MTATCPVCGGPKSKRATLCATCRPKAIAAGVHLLLAAASAPSLEDIASWAAAPSTTASASDAPKLTDGQRRAFHAKANHLDRLRGEPIGTAKRVALATIAAEHANDLTQAQASQLLDQLEQQIADRADRR